MNDERFDVLTDALLDGELSAGEEAELVAALRAEPGRRRELRQHLMLWELWAQQRAPERSADAFLAAWHTRLRAERQSDDFVARLRERISGGTAATSLLTSVGAWWRAAGRSIQVACAASAAAVALIACLWLTIPQHARATTTIHGEAVCTACTLHETHEHLPAIRVRTNGEQRIYYVSSDPAAIQRLGNYCAAPVPLIATGRSNTRRGRLELNVEAAEADRSRPAVEESERRLFPF